MNETSESSRVLIVDDDPLGLEIHRSQLARAFSVDTATGGLEGLERISEGVLYAVVVADMHMPGMSGVEFLERVCEVSPDSVRIMLTSDERQEVAVEAVNYGHVYRFLNKPCSPDLLREAIHDARTQHHKRMAEKEAMAGALDVGTDLLVRIVSIVNPQAAGKAARVHRIVERLCATMELADAWEVTTAAQLSQAGCISFPDEVLRKLKEGGMLSREELKLYQAHPDLGRNLVKKIPRLERVAEIIARQEQPADSKSVTDAIRGSMAWRARLLKIAIDYDRLIEQGWLPHQAHEELSTSGACDAEVLAALQVMIDEDAARQMRTLNVNEFAEGMVLVEDVVDDAGAVLITKGQELSGWLLDRLHRQREGGRCIREPVQVLLPGPAA